MKIVVAPDKFKGSLSSFKVCKAIEKGVYAFDSSIETQLFPMADGGDGFAAVMKHYLITETIPCKTNDPLGRPLDTSYEWNATSKTAIIEMASASGLVLLNKEERNPLLTSTFGTGLLIKDAIQKGAERIILGLGGSATNDAGIGILSALGFKLFSKTKEELYPSGEHLTLIDSIQLPSIISPVKIIIACDVFNVLYGEQGAAYIYGPQKGADPTAVELLDKGLQNFAKVIFDETGKKMAAIPGTGAAGGVAAGLIPFFNVELKKGIEIIAAVSGIDKEIQDADMVITGEGKIDHQSAEGKVVSYVAKVAGFYNKPVIALCGIKDMDEELQRELHITYAESIMSPGVTIDESMKNSALFLEQTTTRLLRKIKKEE